jgi:hypothetical protein
MFSLEQAVSEIASVQPQGTSSVLEESRLSAQPLASSKEKNGGKLWRENGGKFWREEWEGKNRESPSLNTMLVNIRSTILVGEKGAKKLSHSIICHH